MISKTGHNLFQIFFMGTSWVAVSINNITTRASREMTSHKNIKIFYFNGVNVAKHWHGRGEVFAISDCLVENVCLSIHQYECASATLQKYIICLEVFCFGSIKDNTDITWNELFQTLGFV